MVLEAGDVLAAAAMLGRRPDVDATRLFLCGRSLGGIVTVLCAGRGAAFRAACNMCAAALTWDQSPHIRFGCTIIYPSRLSEDHAMAGILGGQWQWLEDMLGFFAWVEQR